jgi:hypothetical protein
MGISTVTKSEVLNKQLSNRRYQHQSAKLRIESMIIDEASPEPRKNQVLRQIKSFTKDVNAGKKYLISTD